MKHRPVNRRAGYTLIELVVSLLGASVLLAGLTSAMFVALKASDTSLTPAQATLAGISHLTDMQAELHYAQTVTEQTATAITVTVPDRNADSNPETIRYAWSATPGDPLTRQYNGGPVANMAEDVHDFSVQYFQPASAIEYLNVRLQISSDTGTSVETSIPLLNRP